MTQRYWAGLAGAVGLGTLVALGVGQREEPRASPDEGIEVLARGPVHEAFAEPAETRPQPSAVVEKRPPDPIDEVPPDEKPEGDDVVWVPGYWAWDGDREDYLWVSGFRRVPPP